MAKKTCRTVYLNKNFEESEIFSDPNSPFTEAEKLKAYALSMIEYSNILFSRSTSTVFASLFGKDGYLESVKTLINEDDHNYSTIGGMKLKSMSDLTGSVKNANFEAKDSKGRVIIPHNSALFFAAYNLLVKLKTSSIKGEDISKIIKLDSSNPNSVLTVEIFQKLQDYLKNIAIVNDPNKFNELIGDINAEFNALDEYDFATLKLPSEFNDTSTSAPNTTASVWEFILATLEDDLYTYESSSLTNSNLFIFDKNDVTDVHNIYKNTYKKQEVLNKAKTNIGSQNHALLERYVVALKKVMTEGSSELQLEFFKNQNFEYVYRKLQESRLLSENDLDNIKQNKSLFSQTFDLIKSYEPKDFGAEVLIGDLDLKVASRLDLTIESKDGKIIVIDFKFIERSTLEKEKIGRGFLKAPAESLPESRYSSFVLQNSLYKYILDKNLPGKEVEVLTVMVEGDLVETLVAGVMQYDYENISMRGDNVKNAAVLKTEYERDIITKLITEVAKGENPMESTVEDLSEIDLLIQDLAGNTEIDEVLNIRNKAIREAKRLDTKGRPFYIDLLAEGGKSKKVFLPENMADRIKILEEYYTKIASHKSSIINQVLQYFEHGSWTNSLSGSKDAYINETDLLLRGIDKETHDLQKLNNISQFRNFPPNILIATNRLTKMVKIINVSMNDNKMLEHAQNEDEKKNRTLFSRFIKTSKFNQMFGFKPLDNDIDSLKILRAGLIAIELKKSGIVAGVESIYVGSITGIPRIESAYRKPKKMFFGVVLHHINGLVKIRSKLGTHKDMKFFKYVEENQKALLPEYYEKNYLSFLPGLIDEYFDFVKLAEKNKLRKRLKDIEGIPSDYHKKKAYLKYLNDLQKLIINKKGITEREKLNSIFEYKIISDIILQEYNIQLKGLNLSDHVDTFFTAQTQNKVSNPLLRELYRVVNMAETKANKDFAVLKNKMNTAYKVLAEHREKNNIFQQAFKGDKYDIFERLYKVKPRQTIEDDAARLDNINDLFMLKDENDPSLEKPERDFIKAFNDVIEESAKRSCTEAQWEKVKWVRGIVPILNDKRENVRRTQGKWAKVKKVGSQFISRNVKQQVSQFDSAAMSYENAAMGQFFDERTRYKLLGLTEDGTAVEPDFDKQENFNFNYDLNAIAVIFAKEGTDAEYMNEALTIVNAMHTIVAIESDENYAYMPSILKDGFNQMIRMQIYAKFREGQKIDQTLDKVKNVSSFMVFGFSPKLWTAESINHFVQTITLSSTALVGKMFKLDAFVTATSFSKAAKMFFSSGDQNLAYALCHSVGITEGDTELLSREKNIASRKNYVGQMRWSSAPVTTSLNAYSQTIFIARLRELGILGGTEKVVEADENGNITYHREKDPRWKGVFNSKGEFIENIAKPADMSKVDLEHPYYRRQMYLAFHQKMVNANMLTEDGKPSFPLDPDQIAEIRTFISDHYTSMDKHTRVLLHWHGWGRWLSSWRNFLFIKIGIYWKNPGLSSHRHDMIWVEDKTHPEGGYFRTDYLQTEGILNSLFHISKGFYDNIKEGGITNMLKGENLDFNKVRKENTAKFITHLTLFAIMTQLISLIFDDDDEDPQGLISRMTERGLTMSANELNFVGMMFTKPDSIANSSPLLLLNYWIRTVTNFVNVLSDLVLRQDLDAAGDDTVKLLKSFGVVRSLMPE